MAEEEQQDFSKLPLDKRVDHKNWRARVSAYEELVKLFRTGLDEDKEWSKYTGWVVKFPVDSNAAGQEKALEATVLFLENAPLPQARKIVGDVMAGIVDKCVAAARAKTKSLAMDVTLLCVEIEKFDLVQEVLMKGMEGKNPKLVASCIGLSTEIIKAFGPKVINQKLILKKMTTLSEDRDKNVRDETKKLMVEMHRWGGPSFKQVLGSVGIKPQIVDEVTAEVDKITDPPTTSRLLRSQQNKKDRLENAEAMEDNANDDEPAHDSGSVEDLLEPFDMLPLLPKDFYDKTQSKKWQERKEALDAVEALSAKPKLQPGDYADLVRVLKTTIAKDSNILLVSLAGKCVTNIAKGLKTKFGIYAPSCIGTILEKFKEKKPQVVTVMREAIDACFDCTSLEAIHEDVVQALGNKNPAVKFETNSFLARAFSRTTTKVMSDKKIMKPFFTGIITNLNEPDANVRDAAAEAFGVALKHLGERVLGSLMADIEPIKLQKVKEYAEKAVITAKTGGGSAAAPSKANAKRAPPPSDDPEESAPRRPAPKTNKTSTVKKESTESMHPPPSQAQPPEKKQGGKAAPRQVATTAKKATAAAAQKEELGKLGTRLPINSLRDQRLVDEAKYKMLKWNFTTPRPEYIDLLKELMTIAGFDETLVVNMFSTDFRHHLKAIDILLEEFQANTEGTKCNLDLILKWTTIRFFDTNPAVLIRILGYLNNMFASFVSMSANLSDAEAQSFLPYLILQLGEAKEVVRNVVHEIIRRISTFYPPQKVFNYLLEGLKSKNARQRADCIEELSFLIQNHGMKLMNPSPQIALKEIGKQIGDRDANVRNAALNCCVQVYFLCGEKLFGLIGEISEKERTLLIERIKRAEKTRPPPGQVTKAAPPPAPQAAKPPPGRHSPPSNPGQRQRPMSPRHVVEPEMLEESGYADEAGMPATEDMDMYIPPSHGPPTPEMAPAPRVNGLPDKYRIDFEAIDRMYNDNEPAPALKLLDTNIEPFVRGDPVALPKRRAIQNSASAPAPRRANDSPPVAPARANQSIDMIVGNLSDTNIRRATEAGVKLEKVLLDSDTSNLVMSRMDAILTKVSWQLQRQQGILLTQDEEKLGELNRYFKSTINMLSVLFKNEALSRKSGTEALKTTIQRLLVLIIDDNLEKLFEAANVIRLVNIMVVRVIENSEPNAISCALIRLLNETIDDGQENSRLLELVMKCQWKLLKQHSVWIQNQQYPWDVKSILAEYSAFVRDHPFASFVNRDGTPLKTIKTIVHALVMQVGADAVQCVINEMPDLQNTEAGIYLGKIVQRDIARRRSASAGGNQNDSSNLNNFV